MALSIRAECSSIKKCLNNRMTVENGGDHQRIIEGKRCTGTFGLIVISDLISANKRRRREEEVTTTVRMEYL